MLRLSGGCPASIVSFPDIVKLIRAHQQHPQAPNPTANDRETDRRRLSPSSKRTSALETSERAGCHGIRQGESVPSFDSKTKNKLSFSPSSEVRLSVESSSVLPVHRRALLW